MAILKHDCVSRCNFAAYTTTLKNKLLNYKLNCFCWSSHKQKKEEPKKTALPTFALGFYCLSNKYLMPIVIFVALK